MPETLVDRTAGMQSRTGSETSERSTKIIRNKKVKAMTCRLTPPAAVALAAKWNASMRYNMMGSLPIKMDVFDLVNKKIEEDHTQSSSNLQKVKTKYHTYASVFIQKRRTKTENARPEDRHNPMNSRLCRPPVPTTKEERAGRFHERMEEQKGTTHNNPIGQKNDPKSSAGIRISGLPFPPFLSASCIRRPMS